MSDGARRLLLSPRQFLGFDRQYPVWPRRAFFHYWRSRTSDKTTRVTSEARGRLEEVLQRHESNRAYVVDVLCHITVRRFRPTNKRCTATRLLSVTPALTYSSIRESFVSAASSGLPYQRVVSGLVILTPPAGRPQMQSDPTSLDVLTRVLTGLHEYTIVAADDTLNSLTVKVIATATSAPCPACGEFSTAVKAFREQTVLDVPPRQSGGVDGGGTLVPVSR
jgi:hypothetical protein